MSNEIMQVPEVLARKADKRAMEIFTREAHMGRTFEECLGQIYMVGVKTGELAATKAP